MVRKGEEEERVKRGVGVRRGGSERLGRGMRGEVEEREEKRGAVLKQEGEEAGEIEEIERWKRKR